MLRKIKIIKSKNIEEVYKTICESEKFLSPTMTGRGIDLKVCARKLCKHGQVLVYVVKMNLRFLINF